MRFEQQELEIVRFLLVGLLSTATHFLVLVLLYRHLGFGIPIASVLSFFCSLAVSYVLNRSFTFRSQTEHRVGVPRYTVVTLSGLLWNVAIMCLMVERLQLNFYLSFVSMSVIVALNNYLLSKKWIFGRETITRV
ncbi:MAG: GtrA family protein [Pseudomonadota bacterium]